MNKKERVRLPECDLTSEEWTTYDLDSVEFISLPIVPVMLLLQFLSLLRNSKKKPQLGHVVGWPFSLLLAKSLTPEDAALLLENFRNPSNRNIRARAVQRLVRYLQSGEYRPWGAPIVVDASRGCIVDGHHRLEACIESGVPLDYVLISIVYDPDAIDYIDVAIEKRTAADVITIKHNIPIHPRVIAAIDVEARDFSAQDPTKGDVALKAQRVVESEYTDFLEALRKENSKLLVGHLAGALRCAKVLGIDAVLPFFSAVASCRTVIDGVEQEAIVAFSRDILRRTTRRGPKGDQEHRYYAERAIKYWNMFRTGRVHGIQHTGKIPDVHP
jgi:hypothetical protein